MIVVVVLIGVLLGGSFFYYSASKVFARAFQKTISFKTVSYNGVIEVKINGTSTLTGSIPASFNNFLAKNIKTPVPQVAGDSTTSNAANSMNLDLKSNFSGQIDQQDASNIKQQANMIINGTSNMPEFTFGAHKLNLDSNAGGAGYLRINEAPQFIYPYVKTFMKQWIKIDLKELGLVKETDTTASQNTEKQAEDVVKNNSPFKITKAFKPEKTDGVYMIHCQYEINKEALKTIIPELDKAAQEQLSSTASAGVSPYDNQKEIDSEIDNMPTVTGEIKVGLFDNRLYMLTVDVPIKDSNTSGAGMSGSVHFEINLSKYDQPVTITAPTKSKSIEEVISSVEGSLLIAD